MYELARESSYSRFWCGLPLCFVAGDSVGPFFFFFLVAVN